MAAGFCPKKLAFARKNNVFFARAAPSPLACTLWAQCNKVISLVFRYVLCQQWIIDEGRLVVGARRREICMASGYCTRDCVVYSVSDAWFRQNSPVLQPRSLAALSYSLIPMTHSPETTTSPFKSTPIFFRCHASCKSGTGFVWYQIPAPISTLFYSKPESGAHVTEMMTYDYD